MTYTTRGTTMRQASADALRDRSHEDERVIAEMAAKLEAMLTGKSEAEQTAMIASLTAQLAALTPEKRAAERYRVAAAERVIAAHG